MSKAKFLEIEYWPGEHYKRRKKIIPRHAGDFCLACYFFVLVHFKFQTPIIPLEEKLGQKKNICLFICNVFLSGLLVYILRDIFSLGIC